MSDADQASPDPRDALMRLSKRDLVEQLVDRDRRLEESESFRRGAQRQLREEHNHPEATALARCLNALEQLNQRSESASRSSGAMAAGPYHTGPERPYVPGRTERVLRHLWLSSGLPDPAAETDRVREQLRLARAKIGDQQLDIENARAALDEDTDPLGVPY